MREIRTLRSKWRGLETTLTVGLMRHSQRKRGATARLNLRSMAPVLDPTKTLNQDADSFLMEEGNTIVRDKRERTVDPA